MTDTMLRTLAKADPARALDPAPSEQLLARLLAEPRLALRPARHRPRRRLLVASLGAAAVAATAVALLGARGGPSLDLAAEAYAATSAGPGQIIHVVATTDRTETTAAGETHDSGRVEEWRGGGESHRVETFTKGGTQVAIDDATGADGVTYETENGSTRIVGAADPQHAAGDVASLQAGFVADFRQRYEHGQLDPAGDVQFAGRPARRYLVELPDDGPRQAFYVDRETGEPLGYTSTQQLELTDSAGTTAPATLRFVETVRTIERLAATPENLASLRPARPAVTP